MASEAVARRGSDEVVLCRESRFVDVANRGGVLRSGGYGGAPMSSDLLLLASPSLSVSVFVV